MNDAAFLLVLPRTVEATESAGDVADEPDIVVSGGAENLGVRQNSVSQNEPPGSPSFAVIRPLVENSSEAGVRSRRRTSTGIAVRSTGNYLRRPRRAGPQQRHHLRRVVPDPGTLQRYTTQRMHFLYSHCSDLPTKYPIKSNPH